MLHGNTCVAQPFLHLYLLLGSVSNYAASIYKDMDILVVCHHARSINFDVDIKANQGFEAAFFGSHPLPNQVLSLLRPGKLSPAIPIRADRFGQRIDRVTLVVCVGSV